MSPVSSSKVVSIQASAKKKKSSASSETEDSTNSITESIKDLGLKVGNKLKEEITSREPERVRLSIKAFKQYRDSHDVKSQEACLLSMIREEAEPNTESKPKTKKTQRKVVSAPKQSTKKLISADKLKQINNFLFNKDD